MYDYRYKQNFNIPTEKKKTYIAKFIYKLENMIDIISKRFIHEDLMCTRLIDHEKLL